jgi:hypothetical protein
MDYNRLLQRLAELDQPTTESAVSECGEMMPAVPNAPPPAPPSMSVNLNAQGMDNIEQLMKLMTKVNPDMINPAAPPAPTAAPMLKLPIDMDGKDDGPLDGDKSEVAPLAAVGAGLGKAAAAGAGALARGAGMALGKSAAAAAAPAAAASMPTDTDSDSNISVDPGSEFSHEDYANEPDEEYKDIDYITNKLAGGLNKPKGTYPKVATGDNPMQKINQMEGDELRAAIRSELQQRLAEAKGAK